MTQKADRVAKEQGKRLAEARLAAGFRSARAAAMEFGWPESTYRAHEAGTRTIGYDDAQRYVNRFRALGAKVTAREIHYGGDDDAVETDDDEVHSIPGVGYVGAGAVIDPDYEQVPPDGLFQIEIPFAPPAEMLAFEVRGDSMRPTFAPGEVLVVYAEPTRPLETFYGEDAVVRISDGRRLLKKIMRGRTRRTVDLHSSDGSNPIEDVRLEWIGEIFCRFPAHQVKRAERRKIGRKHQPKLVTGSTK
jgi:phage repressor protein C with HTH and peptisase S24 domain